MVMNNGYSGGYLEACWQVYRWLVEETTSAFNLTTLHFLSAIFLHRDRTVSQIEWFPLSFSGYPSQWINSGCVGSGVPIEDGDLPASGKSACKIYKLHSAGNIEDQTFGFTSISTIVVSKINLELWSLHNFTIFRHFWFTLRGFGSTPSPQPVGLDGRVHVGKDGDPIHRQHLTRFVVHLPSLQPWQRRREPLGWWKRWGRGGDCGRAGRRDWTYQYG